MLKTRNDHEVATKRIDGDYLKGEFVDGLYVSRNGTIVMTVRGKGKAHLASIGSSTTICNRGTNNMGSTYSLAARSKPVKLCKTCQGSARGMDLRFISGGWYDIPLMGQLHSFEMLKDGRDRLFSFRGLKPFHMTPSMRNPYVSALVGGDRILGVESKHYHDKKRQLTGIEDLHDVTLVDLVETAAKNYKVKFDFMKFYPITASYDHESAGVMGKISYQLSAAATLLNYDALEVGVLFVKPESKVDLYHTLAFGVRGDDGNGIISLSGVPPYQQLGGKDSTFDTAMNTFSSMIKEKIGSRQKWVI